MIWFLAVAVMLLTVGASAAGARLVFGINDNAGTVLNWRWIMHDHPERLGARLLRVGMRWDIIEPARDQWRFGSYDRLVAVEARRGLELLPVLLVNPTWAAAPNVMPQDPSDFAKFVGRVAHRYGPHGTFWIKHPKLNGKLAIRWLDIWNEPYLLSFSTEPSPGTYARLLRASAIAARAGDRHVRILMETDAHYQNSDGSFSHDWIAGLYQAVPDLNRYFQAVSVHMYCGDVRLTFSSEDACQRLPVIHAELAAHGAGSKPVWVTEFGAATCGGLNPPRPGCVSDETQADQLQSMLAYFSSLRFVSGFFPYSYRDLDFRRYNYIRDSYGLLNWWGERKPALATWMQFVEGSGPFFERRR